MIEVNLKLHSDSPNSMSFGDTYEGLENPWYKIETDKHGNIWLWANEEGFEHLARVFLKFARGSKVLGYHSHHSSEFGKETESGQPEWTLTLCEETKDA